MNRYSSDYTIENNYMTKVFGWMFLALMVTAFVSFMTIEIPALTALTFGGGYFLFAIAELVLVIVLSRRITRMSSATASIWFVVYAILNGLTLTPIVLQYTGQSIVSAFVITAVSFGAMCLYGLVTKNDLTSVGSIAFYGLFGLIVAMIVNIFMESNALAWVISIGGVVIFTALTAYDTQKIKRNYAYQQFPILGALSLYLDFINLFLFILRIVGRRS